MEMIRRIFKRTPGALDFAKGTIVAYRELINDYITMFHEVADENERLHGIALDLDAQIIDLHARIITILNILMTAPSVKRMNKADYDAIMAAIDGPVPASKEATL